MPKPLRVFISSPGDVPDERLRADLVIDKLNQDYGRYFTIESYRWEHEPMLASGHFQDAIAPPSQSDIVILMLWSRLGTPLPEKSGTREYRGIDGRAPVTGTEWEFEDALAAARAKGAPDILVFRNVSPASIDSRDPDARARSLAQLDALDAFWKRYFADRGVFLAASSEYRTLEDFATRLEESLRKLIERRIKAEISATGGEAPPTWLGNPFRGLQAYEFEHAAIYFGRDALVAKAAENIATEARQGSAFLLVAGASGSGKSSLVKAAVVPRLMKPQRIEGIAFLRRLVFRPSDAQNDLFLGLIEALVRGPAQDGVGLPELLSPGQSAKDLATYLRSTADSAAFLFSGALGRVTDAARNAKRILPHEQAKMILVIDQFEELFTLATIGDQDRQAFAKLLSGLAHSGVVWVIATIRADFWHRILDVPELVALADGQGRLDVPPPSPAEIAEMIRKPALAAGLRFQTHGETGLGLDTVMAEHAASAPGVLPLLSFTLDALYTEDVQKRGGSELTYQQYEALGGLEGAIATRAEDVVAQMPDQTRQALPRVLRALATIGDSESDTPVARSVSLDHFPPGSDTRAVVDALVAARLLVASSDGASATVRLAHEALISRWARAKDQLAADRRDLQTRAVIERQHARWRQASGIAHQHHLLLRDPDLANALDLQRRWGDELSPDINTFIAQSRQRARRQQQFVAAAAVVFGIIALAATAFGFLAYQAQQLANRETARAVEAETAAVTQRDDALHQRNAALVSQSRYLAGEADRIVKDGNVRGAIALLREALPDPANPNNRPLVEEAVSAAYHALYSNRERGRLPMPKGVAAIASDGQAGEFAIATADRIFVRKGLTESGQTEIAHDFGAPDRMVLAPKGDRLAMIGRDGSIAVWDLAAKRQLMRQPARGNEIQVAFVRDGERLLIHTADQKSWWLIDAASGQQLGARQLEAGAQHPIVSTVDARHDLVVVIAGAQILRLSLDDLTDLVSAPIEQTEQYAAAASSDGKALYVAAGKALLEGHILVFDASTLALQRTFGKLSGGAISLAISPNSKVLALHGLIGIDFFDVPAGERLYNMVIGRNAAQGRFIGRSGSDYVAYGPNGFIRNYSADLGIEIGAYRTIDGGTIEQIDELPDHSGFVTISDRPSATVWTFNTQTASKDYTVPLVIQGRDMAMASLIETLAFAGDGMSVLASYIDKSALRWDLRTGTSKVVRDADATADSIEQAALLQGGISLLAEKSGRLLVYTDDGLKRPAAIIATEPLVAVGAVDATHALMLTKGGVATLIDLSAPAQPKLEPVPALTGCQQMSSDVGFALCLTKDGGIRVWRASENRVVFDRPAPAGAKVTAAYTARKGDLVAISDSKGKLTVNSLPDGKSVGEFQLTIHLTGDTLKAAAQSPLLSDEERAKIRAGATALDVSIGANHLSLSPDGKTVAAAMPDRTVKLIEIGSGKIVELADGHKAITEAFDYSPNGGLLAAIEESQYRALNIYDTTTGQRVVSIGLGGQPSPRLSRLADGTGFATVDKGGHVMVHPVFENPRDFIAFLAREYPEGLTPNQRRAYFIE